MYVNQSWKVFFIYSKANTGANKSIKKKNIGETTVISLFCNAVLTLTWCQCSSCGAAKAGMWKERGGEGLDSRLSHRGHTRSSLWDEFTCCRVWSLVAQKDNKLSDTPLPIEALKAKDKKSKAHEMHHIYVSSVLCRNLNCTHLGGKLVYSPFSFGKYWEHQNRWTMTMLESLPDLYMKKKKKNFARGDLNNIQYMGAE